MSAFQDVRVFSAMCAICGMVALAASSAEHVPGFIWIEAEDFAERGDWTVDTQFTHKMGSAYLICRGANTPRPKVARTTVLIPRAGTWRVWARTKDWLPEFSPGRFVLEVNGRRGKVLGEATRCC